MNQRAGKMHQAGANDSNGGSISIKELIQVLKQCQQELGECGEEDSALRFELFRQWIEEEVAFGKPVKFKTAILGL